MGTIEPVITNHIPAIPYTVSAWTHTGREKELIASLESNRVRGSISRPSHAAEVEFFLTADGGKLRQRHVYRSRPEAFEPMPYEEIAVLYGRDIPQDDTDSIRNEETKYFVFVGDSRWGFYVVPITRRDELLHLGPKRFLPSKMISPSWISLTARNN